MLRYKTKHCSVDNQRRPLVSRSFKAVNKKSNYRCGTSCQRSTHSRGGKPPGKAKSPTAPDSPVAQHIIWMSPPDLTHFPSASSRRSDKASERANDWRACGCWTDQAYLWMALCAWADPACRSFCHSHNFFSLSRGERGGRATSVSKPPRITDNEI